MILISNRLNSAVSLLWLFFSVFCLCQPLRAQDKKTEGPSSADSSFLGKPKGLLGRLAKSIISDTTEQESSNLQRIDILYRRYTGRIIRNIEVRTLDFGVPLNDTSKSFKNTLTKLADALHVSTREYVIRNNLFFKKNDRLLPILLADNERHIRDLAYINDAKIIVRRVAGTSDSVDIVVLTKDVLSIGGRLRMSRINKVLATVREDNLAGWGDQLQVGTFFDQSRRKKFAFGAQYVARNIGGSFVDGYIGYEEYAPAFNSLLMQESMLYTRFVKPLVNPYMKWTYAVEAAWHRNSNMYLPDSFYLAENKYQYYNVDAWVGMNMSAKNLSGVKKGDDRLRTLIGLRFIHQEFQEVPKRYEEEYFYRYADLTGVLGSISLFRQDFYKTKYVYGFGRNEDVPEGLDFSVTTGWTNKHNRVRPYMGLNMGLNHFTRKRHYFNYVFRVGAYNYQRKYEDISVLANVEFFSRLKQMGERWKQRLFVTAGLTTQWNRNLNEPLLLESQYGLPEYENINLGGDHRLTIKAESVFFSPWSMFNFKFAPFVFANGTLLTPEKESIGHTQLYNTIGAGIRTRNESLVFGTIEFRSFYFPGRNFNGESFRFEINTSIRFKYTGQFIRRPEFIQLN